MIQQEAPNVQKYNHVEAFCLMLYKNRDTGRSFMVWNSRDGVTPFCVIEDQLEFNHANWGSDKCMPDLTVEQLPDGHRYFRDTTPSEAAYIALRRMIHFNNVATIERDSPEWYQTWARVTESFIGQPIMLKHEKPKPDVPATPVPKSFKETNKLQAEFRRQKNAFNKLSTEAEKVEFLANAEPFAREFWAVQTSGNIAWWPTLAGIPFMNTEYGTGFTTPEEAFAKAVELKAEFTARL